MSNSPFLTYQGCLPARVQLFSQSAKSMQMISWTRPPLLGVLQLLLQQTRQGWYWESGDSSPAALL